MREKIYPSEGQLKSIAANYAINKYPEIFGEWSDKKWTLYFKNYLLTKVG